MPSLWLYHFSEEPDISVFEPRIVPEERRMGREGLDNPLVWAIDDSRAPLYYFPRDCPRIFLWLLPATTEADRERWFGATSEPMIAHIEWAWLDRMRSTALYRYIVPSETFVPDGPDQGPGCYTSRETVRPLSVEPVGDLLDALRDAGVELRLVSTLTSLRGVWDTTLHASGIRLANAHGWK